MGRYAVMVNMLDPSNPIFFIAVVGALYGMFCLIFWEHIKDALYAVQSRFM